MERGMKIIRFPEDILEQMQPLATEVKNFFSLWQKRILLENGEILSIGNFFLW